MTMLLSGELEMVTGEATASVASMEKSCDFVFFKEISNLGLSERELLVYFSSKILFLLITE